MSEDAQDKAERILAELSQEERLKLLERLLQATTAKEEATLTVEERLAHLEKAVLGQGRRKKVRILQMGGDASWSDDDSCCICC